MITIYSTNPKSKSAKLLAKALNIKTYHQLLRRRNTYKIDTIINWGASEFPHSLYASINSSTRVLNYINLIQRSNKLEFFKLVEGYARVVPWTEDINKAVEWQKKDCEIIGRNTLIGHGGLGIHIYNPLDALGYHPLYTKYIRKEQEYRLHYVKGKLIHVQRKAIKRGEQPNSWTVRSYNNGFIYVHGEALGEIPQDVLVQGLAAFNCSGFDFGAIDVLSTKTGKAYVLEINTGPGLAGLTVIKYANAFKELLRIAV